MSYRWKPSKSSKVEFAKKMEAIDKFCYENKIQKSSTSDSYYFILNGIEYRISNHSVESSNLKSGNRWHEKGREKGVIYIHASKTRIIEIYQNLEKGLQLDGRGNIKK